jgi:hypothetical protein
MPIFFGAGINEESICSRPHPMVLFRQTFTPLWNGLG